jgi:hypothetical protein
MSRAPEPVSWFLIERGWKVEALDGTELGKVEETVGDSTHDIFNGLTVAPSLLGRAHYVPAELVAEIREGSIRLSLGTDEFEKLGEYQEPPPTEQLRPE